MARKRNTNERMTAISIPEKMHEFLVSKRMHKEPIYVTLDRIIQSYLNSDIAQLQDDYQQAIEGVRIWKEKALDLQMKQQEKEQMRFA